MRQTCRFGGSCGSRGKLDVDDFVGAKWLFGQRDFGSAIAKNVVKIDGGFEFISIALSLFIVYENYSAQGGNGGGLNLGGQRVIQDFPQSRDGRLWRFPGKICFGSNNEMRRLHFDEGCDYLLDVEGGIKGYLM